MSVICNISEYGDIRLDMSWKMSGIECSWNLDCISIPNEVPVHAADPRSCPSRRVANQLNLNNVDIHLLGRTSINSVTVDVQGTSVKSTLLNWKTGVYCR